MIYYIYFITEKYISYLILFYYGDSENSLLLSFLEESSPLFLPQLPTIMARYWTTKAVLRSII